MFSRRDQEIPSKSAERSTLYDGGEWVRGRLLGRGAFGSVHVAYFPNPKTELFEGFPEVAAVKSADTGTASAKQLRTEVMMGLRLKGCPFVVRLLGGDVTVAEDDGRLVDNLFMELASEGTLSDVVMKNRRRRSTPGLEEWKVRRLTKSVVGGLARIHELGFVHRDVKLDNMLLVKEANGGFTAKVADLGQARKEKAGKFGRVGGTVSYWSPEVVAEGFQRRPADVWALGCAVFGMLTGKLPWDYIHGRRLSRCELMWAIGECLKEPSLPAGEYSPAAEDFVEKCLRRDPTERATAAELLCHPFVGGEYHQVWWSDDESEDSSDDDESDRKSSS